MKKIFATAVLITVCIYMTGSPVSLHAAGGFTFSLGSAEATPGETVTIPISVENNLGFAAVGLVVTYDPAALEIVRVTDIVPDMALNSQFALTTIPGVQWIHLVNTQLSDWRGDGTVAYITFNVQLAASVGSSTIRLTFTETPDGTPINANGNTLKGTVRTLGTTVNIKDASPAPNLLSNPSPAPTPRVTSSAANPTPTTGATASAPAVSAPEPSDVTGSSITLADDYDLENPQLLSDTYEPEIVPFFEDVNQNAFIGAQYNVEETSPEPAVAGVYNVANFGRVPQTGIRGIAFFAAASCVLFLTACVMGIWLLRNGHTRRNNGKT
jgi:hypothetical protein